MDRGDDRGLPELLARLVDEHGCYPHRRQNDEEPEESPDLSVGRGRVEPAVERRLLAVFTEASCRCHRHVFQNLLSDEAIDDESE